MFNKKEENTEAIRLSYNEREQLFMKVKMTAMENAVKNEKVRYKSTHNPKKFLSFLEKRLDLWNSLKTNKLENGRFKKGFTNRHHQRMYDKTHEIINSLRGD